MTTPTAATPISLSTPTHDPVLASRRARARAIAEHTRAWRTSDPTVWTVRTQIGPDDRTFPHHYVVQQTGVLSTDLTCDCPAGTHGRICKHVVAVAEARHLGWDAICMGISPAPAAAHCAGCGRWYPAHDDSSCYCDDCLAAHAVYEQPYGV